MLGFMRDWALGIALVIAGTTVATTVTLGITFAIIGVALQIGASR